MVIEHEEPSEDAPMPVEPVGDPMLGLADDSSPQPEDEDAVGGVQEIELGRLIDLSVVLGVDADPGLCGRVLAPPADHPP
jgi:hypothetical protein